jgi:hypothetical protein
VGILEKEVLVNVVSANAKYYEKKGYEVPKYVDKYNKSRYIIGSKILVKVTDLPSGSDVKVTKVCDDCGDQLLQPYGGIITRRKVNNNKDRCFNCGNVYKQNKIKEQAPSYERSLEFWSLSNNKKLLSEFSEKNNKIPRNISYGSSKEYLWSCIECSGEYKVSVAKKTTGGQECPYCMGKKVLIGFNDLFTTHPNVADLLHDSSIGYKRSFGSNKTEEFKCKDCDTIAKKKICEVVIRGFHCPKCSDGLSYPEKFMYSILSQLKIDFETQKQFEWSKKKRYDFYIKEPNTIIEVHGEQHFKFTGFNRTLEEEIVNDKIKMELAKNNGITEYIVINCSQSDLMFIKNNVYNSNISNIYNLDNVDWAQCNEYATNSLIKSASDLWNQGVKSTGKISEILNIHSSNIIKYLKKAVEFGWCDYEAILGGYRENKLEIVQFSLNGEFIKEWSCIKDASRELNIEYTSLAQTCKNEKRKSSGGYLWKYKKDYLGGNINPYSKIK